MSKLNSPLFEFDNARLIFAEPQSNLKNLINTTDADLNRLSDDQKEFLSVQAEMLSHSKILEQSDSALSKAKFDERSFEGIVLNSIRTYTSKGREKIDFYDSETQQIHLCPHNLPNFPPTKSGVILGHEMTHAIDDIYDNRSSADKVLDVLKKASPEDIFESKDFQTKVIRASANIIDSKGIRSDFGKLYCTPALSGPQSFVAACESADIGAKGRQQQRIGTRLQSEFVSFAIEKFFEELGTVPPSSTLIDRYNGAYVAKTIAPDPTAISKRERQESDSVKINKVAQEVVAVSVVAVLDHMIAHINTPSLQASIQIQAVNSTSVSSISTSAATALSPTRQSLLNSLERLRDSMEPALDRVAKRTQELNEKQYISSTIATDTKDSSSSKKTKLGRVQETEDQLQTPQESDRSRLMVHKMRGRSNSLTINESKISASPILLSRSKSMPTISLQTLHK